MHKLIVVEGVMGSGKSTTSQLITEHLVGNRISCRCIGEGADGHPVQMKDPESIDEVDAWKAEHLDKWRVFAGEILSQDNVLVLDGQLFHENVDSLVFCDTSESEIREYIGRILDILDQTNPVLIYLYQQDLSAAIRKTFDERSDWWENWQIDWKVNSRPFCQNRGLTGFEGFVALYIAYRKITDRLVDEMDIAKLAIENGAGNWDLYMDQILKFIDQRMGVNTE